MGLKRGEIKGLVTLIVMFVFVSTLCAQVEVPVELVNYIKGDDFRKDILKEATQEKLDAVFTIEEVSYISSLLKNESLDVDTLHAYYQHKFDFQSSHSHKKEAQGSEKRVNGPCENMDFEECSFNGWELHRGKVDKTAFGFLETGPGNSGVGFPDANASPSITHSIVSSGVDVLDYGADPAVSINMVRPDGGGCSAVLGDGKSGDHGASSMRQTFKVDKSNQNFTYQYAVVMENPDDHEIHERPYFRVRMYDESGQSIVCAEYDIYSGNGNPDWGFVRKPLAVSIMGIVLRDTINVEYIDWQSAFIPLSAYMGQNVTVEFSTGDCWQVNDGIHWSYAFVEASCDKFEMEVVEQTACGGSAVITAPAGADSYAWSTGETTQSIEVFISGDYSVTMTAPSGCDVILDTTLTIKVTNPAVVADYSTNEVCLGVESVFTDLSPDPSSIITSWEWDFETDGVIDATSANTSFTYTQAGVYDVTLTVTTADGCKSVKVKQVVVNPVPQASFTAVEVCFGKATEFTNTSAVASGGGSNFDWDFGDSLGVSEDENPEYVYPLPGTYNVSLEIAFSGGCTSKYEQQVVVSAADSAIFIAIDACLNEQIIVEDQTPNATNWSWDIQSDGVVDFSVQNPKIYYSKAGDYEITLVVKNPSGCSSVAVQTVTVYPVPTADFYYNPIALDEYNTEADFFDSSTGGDIVSWLWGFAGKDSSSISDPIYDFENPGEYLTSLMVTNSFGCTAVTERLLVVTQTSTVYIPNAFTPNNDGVNDFFEVKGTNLNSFELFVFDRWGELIFYSEDIEESWDGTINGVPAQEDVYVWKVNAHDSEERKQVYYGHVTVVR